MAASSSDNKPNPLFNGLDPNSVQNTTFVQADPSTFRAVVQRLTGKTVSGEMGPRRSVFKLHERRPTTRKLEINLGALHSPPPARNSRSENTVMVSPVSPLEYLTAPATCGSTRNPRSPVEEEERAIADKGFYLHPSPLSTPRGSDPPELLPLFPLCSPRDNYSSSA